MIELRDVSVRFGGVRALDRISVSAGSGLTALIGPNGAGKTTLMNVICGLTRTHAGTVHFRDRDVTRWRAHRIARLGMARTFQSIALFDDMTVLENVLVGLHTTMRAGTIASALRLPRHCRDEHRAHEAAEAQLTRFGLERYADQPATALPHGLQRQVELARALAADPALLLLDEPLAGLAQDEIDATGRIIRALADAGTAVLLVEHSMDAVMSLSDHIVVLDHGALLAEGPPARIQADERVVTAYLGTC